MVNKQVDTVYADPLATIEQFRFDDKVAAVFADMIKRSVPGYSTILNMIGDITERYVQDNSQCYDLGCSLGAATLAMRHKLAASGCQIISIDNSPAMIERCRHTIELDTNSKPSLTPVELYCCNIDAIDITNASIVVLNFTLQFIPLEQRQTIIQSIYDGLLPGGILLLSEKVMFEDEPHQQLLTDLYHNFKRNNGYSNLEIAQKRTALEDFLQPETIDTHKQRLKSAGFASADVWFQCLTFASVIAIKDTARQAIKG
ncbi:MAG: tRNA (cmo5U34)-methyltransferase [Cellvibrionaceae bacterium]|jgi:tRNA (cmo5U34)-methyltransferase